MHILLVYKFTELQCRCKIVLAFWHYYPIKDIGKCQVWKFWHFSPILCMPYVSIPTSWIKDIFIPLRKAARFSAMPMQLLRTLQFWHSDVRCWDEMLCKCDPLWIVGWLFISSLHLLAAFTTCFIALISYESSFSSVNKTIVWIFKVNRGIKSELTFKWSEWWIKWESIQWKSKPLTYLDFLTLIKGVLLVCVRYFSGSAPLVRSKISGDGGVRINSESAGNSGIELWVDALLVVHMLFVSLWLKYLKEHFNLSTLNHSFEKLFQIIFTHVIGRLLFSLV